MRDILIAATLVLGVFSTPVMADQKSADYIVSQTVTREMFEGAIAAQRSLILSAIQHDLKQKNVTLPNPDRFFDLLMEEFLDEFTESMQAQSAQVFLDAFTSEQLVEIASFFATDAGQAYIAATPTLMMEGARMGQIAGQKAGANAGKRLANRIEDEGLIVVDDPGLLERLLDALK
ncbi:DUF2059 domain-containing protein [Maritalea porphyrae]|uniref:DUF2059 domain-containing protein n=1 Tax=Maritalea porphyrae TaxID=880732 RepID=A0ABQ5UMW4_9HYPH|nr:DUF2059 domain-containing protein [Maritalea porphyrae]GLQ16179.1 hypothetical protein GCM10007879_04280 [Maritalea porphyrae]